MTFGGTYVYIAATPAISRIIAQHSTFLDVDIVKYAFSSMTSVVEFEGAEVLCCRQSHSIQVMQ